MGRDGFHAHTRVCVCVYSVMVVAYGARRRGRAAAAAAAAAAVRARLSTLRRAREKGSSVPAGLIFEKRPRKRHGGRRRRMAFLVFIFSPVAAAAAEHRRGLLCVVHSDVATAIHARRSRNTRRRVYTYTYARRDLYKA